MRQTPIREKRIAEAKGDVENFKQVLARYSLGPEVTRTRMYLETMRDVLPKAKIYIMKDGDKLSGYCLWFPKPQPCF